jgi:hypothetical protein
MPHRNYGLSQARRPRIMDNTSVWPIYAVLALEVLVILGVAALVMALVKS